MLSIHTTVDGLVLPSQETELRETLEHAGGFRKQRQLLQKYVEANGHCTLTQADWTAALVAMEHRLKTGRWSDAFFVDFEGESYDERVRFVDFDPGQFPQPALQ